MKNLLKASTTLLVLLLLAPLPGYTTDLPAGSGQEKPRPLRQARPPFPFSPQVSPEQTYPRVTAYASFIHPIVTFDKNGSSFNFSDSYTVGFPVGINILKSDRIGFSFEMVPFLKVADGVDKASNLLFHPGVLFRRKYGFTLITRLAFETSGRYGMTQVFNKVFLRKKEVSYFVATPVPVRFGNTKPPSVGLILQLGANF